MARPIYQRVAVNNNGDVIPGAEFTVTNENTGLEQTIYDARSGGSVISQPAFADANGVIQFYTEPGVTYRVEATGGVGTYTDRYVEANSAMTDLSDPTSGNLMPVGAFGVGEDAVVESVTNLNDLIPVGVYRAETSALNLPTAGRGGILFVTRRLETSSNIRSHQYFMNLDEEIWQRFNINGAWTTWQELYHTGNLNLFEFGGGVNGRDIADGFAESATVAEFRLPISSYSIPTSVTVNSTFTILTASGSVVASLVVPTITGRTSNKRVTLQVSGLSGMTAGEPLRLRTDTTTSRITVNA